MIKRYLYRFFYQLGLIVLLVFVFSGMVEDVLAKGGKYVIVTGDIMKPAVNQLTQVIKIETGETDGKIINYASSSGQKWIKKLELKEVPMVIFNKDIVDNKKFFDLVSNGIIKRRKGEYVLSNYILNQYGRMVVKRKPISGQLEVFIRSYCPRSIDAIWQLDNYLKLYPENKLRVSCRYVTRFREFGIDSPEGPKEIKENIRQAIIQKYYPDKFWDYLEKFRQRKNLKISCQELGIDAAEINSFTTSRLSFGTRYFGEKLFSMSTDSWERSKSRTCPTEAFTV